MDDPHDELYDLTEAVAELLAGMTDLGLVDDGAFDLLLEQQCVLYGRDGDLSRLDRLHLLYLAWMEVAAPAERLGVLGSLCDLIRAGETDSSALISFLYMEDDLGVLSEAAAQLAQLYRPQSDGERADPLAGPRLVRGMVEETDDDLRRAGLLAGLMLLGDLRVVPLIRGCWHLLGFRGQQQLVKAWRPPALAGSVEFFVDWLEEAEGPVLEAVAGLLARIPGEVGSDGVLEIERAYPGAGPSDPVRASEWTVAEYGSRLVGRLRRYRAQAQERDENSELISRVEQAWGLRA